MPEEAMLVQGREDEECLPYLRIASSRGGRSNDPMEKGGSSLISR